MNLLEKILLAIDFVGPSDNVIKNAMDLAKTFDSRITPIHVLPPGIEDEKARRLLQQAAEKQLSRLKEHIEQKGIKAEPPILTTGIHFEEIVNAGERSEANLIVIGASEKKDTERFPLGTTAEKIIRKSTKPVWVVKHDQPLEVKTILCPIDFSRESRRALKHALVIARRFEAKLLILSVFETSSPTDESPTHDWDAFVDYWQKQENKAHAQFLDQYDKFLDQFNLHDLTWEKIVAEGKPAAEILSAISRFDVDLLIMGTTGRTGLSRLMMGSVTEKVIREVPCTFLTMKSEDALKLQLESRISNIEKHYSNAVQLMKDGFYEEAINEYKNCLLINDMHTPSLFGIAKVYEKTGNQEKADIYRKMAREVLDRIWNSRIEAEARKFYSS